ncbi:DUF1684 domain-containing protein [Thalassiella azotivora]
MSLSLLDWRRRVSDLYRDVRALSVDDPQGAHTLWARTRSDLLMTHEQSPVAAAHRGAGGVPVHPYDSSFRFEVELQPVEPMPLEVPTGTDGVVRFDRIGRVELPDLGGLDVWWLAGYGGGVFVPLRDGTSGNDGYGGGRYLLDTVKGADLGTSQDGTLLVVDLNFAYHPSCAYDPAWACPLAPAGNRLEADAPVGERYEGPWAHT